MISSYLEQASGIKKIIDKASLRFINDKRCEYNYENGNETKERVFNRLSEFITRGKSIRGTLFYYIANELGCKNKKNIIDFAVGLELMHSALLIHDDIMDNDLLRRGRPSMYAQYIKDIITDDKKIATETAKSIAISVGDLAIFIAFDLFNRALKDNPRGLEIMTRLIKDYSLTGLGQIDDVFFGGSDIEPSPKEITRVFLYKTARYTFSLPLSIAALFVGKPKDFVKNLDLIGESMGIVFQMRDDEIGFFGESEKIGKTVGVDIVKNNKTLIRYYLYKNSSLVEKKELDKIFGKTVVTKKNIETLKNIALSNGAIGKIKKIKLEHGVVAKANINKIKNKNIRNSLNNLLVYLNNRNS
jgi:geranylgeranyl diphosphate synthase type I